MAFFSGISTQKRDSASEADGGELFKGAAFIAAGVLAASYMTMVCRYAASNGSRKHCSPR